ncbi:MAG: uracil-DNA glycosylase family protein [Motiliproteus sp.]|nr:uracil-DNA glycosylase family protein [Motiliproteus sp.]MCW9050815.1 uracil-DNA glycosylase family protein [Motiliproteus sp.]
MSDVEKLLKQVRDCRLCEAQLPLGPRPVVQLDPDARILIVGQAPGRKVHETGIPFNDPSGKRLREWLGISSEVFYDPQKIALLPMGFCYPGTGKSGDLPPRPECAKAWREPLLNQIKNLQLTLVIGQYAHAYHFSGPKMSLTERVQHWQDYLPNRIPLPHPSPRNNLWLRRNPWFEAELLPVLKARVTEVLA